MALVCLLLAGCVVVPRSAQVYDPECRSFVRQVVLETAVVGGLGSCHNEGCATLLATLGLVAAASAVVSGSVAVIGNIVHWVERGGQCPTSAQAKDAGPPAPPLPSAAPPAAPDGRATRPAAPPVVPGLVPLPATTAASSAASVPRAGRSP